MSRLDELIQELCPNGVEYRTIESCTINVSNMKWKDHLNDEFLYIDLGSVDRETHHITDSQVIDYKTAPSRAQQIVQTDDILFGTTRPMLKRFCSITKEYDNQIASTGFCVLRANREIIVPRFLFHVIGTGAFYQHIQPLQVEGNYPSVSNASVKAYKMPVPPMPIQREIVRILDNFTELSAELSAELTARKKQYEYYREVLLSFSDDVIKKKIGEVCDVLTGGEPPMDCIKGETPDATHPYAVWGNGKDVYGYASTYRVNTDAVVISSIGANTGAVYFRKAFFTPIIRLKVVIPKNDRIDMRYLFHVLSATRIESKSSSVPNMNAGEIKSIKISVPDINVQRRIADILDRFDCICTDYSKGLPAEIEARQKQYEYYRDKLLTFKEKTA